MAEDSKPSFAGDQHFFDHQYQRRMKRLRNRQRFLTLLNDHYTAAVDATVLNSTPQTRTLQAVAWNTLQTTRAAAKAVR